MPFVFHLAGRNAHLSEKNFRKGFSLLESHTEVNVKETEPSMSPWLAPAFYLTVPLDEEKDNSVYINDISKTDPVALFTTLAHEGYPGHLYQTVSFNHSESCLLRHLLYYPGYVGRMGHLWGNVCLLLRGTGS